MGQKTNKLLIYHIHTKKNLLIFTFTDSTRIQTLQRERGEREREGGRERERERERVSERERERGREAGLEN